MILCCVGKEACLSNLGPSNLREYTLMLHGLGGGASPTIVLISHKSYLPNSCTRLTMRRVMDTAKLVMKSGNLNEFSMVLLNNILSLPLGVLLIFVFKEVDYLFET
ncbi:hypothetical protein HHK36_009222 [Tetracentron sinense]|uniref:Uncharacterized protein n=1 Tax=Tetracentron sinense TaxID=13715 RepID=A0A834ZBD1_TETSI|nr:hypothetical protein HHK36_009222 [Tetracentron sinense]